MPFGKKPHCIFHPLLGKRNDNDYIPSFLVETLVLDEPKHGKGEKGEDDTTVKRGLDNPEVGSQRNGWVKLY